MYPHLARRRLVAICELRSAPASLIPATDQRPSPATTHFSSNIVGVKLKVFLEKRNTNSGG